MAMRLGPEPLTHALRPRLGRQRHELPQRRPGQQVWYDDTDGNGARDPLTSVEACAVPYGYGTEATDCDKGGGAVTVGLWRAPGPHAGVVVHGDIGLSLWGPSGTGSPLALLAILGALFGCSGPGEACVPVTGYADADGDGFGAVELPEGQCALPVGYVEDGQDCDDGDPSVSPTGVETCRTGLDANCDGEGPVCTWDLSNPTDLLLGESQSDRAGKKVAPGPDGTMLVISEGRAYFWRGPVEGTMYLAEAEWTRDRPQGEYEGEFLVSAQALPNARWFFGTDTHHVFYEEGAEQPYLTYVADRNHVGFRHAVTDTNGDGSAEVVLNGPMDVFQELDAGSVLLIDASRSGTVVPGEEDARVEPGAGDIVGLGAILVGPGDVDGDGLDDVVVGSQGYTDTVLLYGPLEGVTSTDDAETWFEDVGEAIATGDLSGDGRADLLTFDSSGDILLYVEIAVGPISPWYDASARLEETDPRCALGGTTSRSMVAEFDADADGWNDVAIRQTCTQDVGASAAGLWIAPGPFEGVVRHDSHGGWLLSGGQADGVGYVDLYAPQVVDLDEDGSIGFAFGQASWSTAGLEEVGAVIVDEGMTFQ